MVYDVVQQVFNGALERGYNRAFAFDLFAPISTTDERNLGLMSTKDITDRILDGQKASDISQKDRNMRLGYMGHLTLIAEEVCKFGNRFPAESLDAVIAERINREEWTQYVDGTLAETRDKDNAVLGGVRPENAMVRPGGGNNQSGFSTNTTNALASAGIGTGTISEEDSLAMSEGTVGESYEVGNTSMLSHFGEDEDDMDDSDLRDEERRSSLGSQFSEDEQVGELSLTSIWTIDNDTPHFLPIPCQSDLPIEVMQAYPLDETRPFTKSTRHTLSLQRQDRPYTLRTASLALRQLACTPFSYRLLKRLLHGG